MSKDFQKFYNSISGLNDDPDRNHIEALFDMIVEQNNKIEELQTALTQQQELNVKMNEKIEELEMAIDRTKIELESNLESHEKYRH